MKRQIQTSFTALLMTVSASQALHSQGVLAEVHGIVTDSSGLALPNATVTVVDTAKGWTRVLKSNDRGEYELP